MGRLAGVGRRRIDRILIVVKTIFWGPNAGLFRWSACACVFSRRSDDGVNDKNYDTAEKQKPLR